MINRWRKGCPSDRRQEMIDETSEFLTWALENRVKLPRIPSRAVERGGFERLRKVPGARAAMSHWWSRALDRMASIGRR